MDVAALKKLKMALQVDYFFEKNLKYLKNLMNLKFLKYFLKKKFIIKFTLT
jgi:hypothetical protein